MYRKKKNEKGRRVQTFRRHGKLHAYTNNEEKRGRRFRTKERETTRSVFSRAWPLTELAVSVHVGRRLDPARDPVRVPLAALSAAAGDQVGRRTRMDRRRGRSSATHLSGTATSVGRIELAL